MDWLEKCYEERDLFCCWLKVDPIYDGLRADPRFQALLKKVGLDRWGGGGDGSFYSSGAVNPAARAARR